MTIITESMTARISRAINESGRKRSEIAKALDVSPSFITQLCSGSCGASSRTLNGICLVLGINATWLFTGIGEMYTDDGTSGLRTRIRQVRKNFELSQSAFGARIGVSRDMINNLENGRAQISELVILAICNEYGVDKHWMHTGAGEMLTAKPSSDTSFRARALSMLANLDDDDWALLEKLAKKLAGLEESSLP